MKNMEEWDMLEYWEYYQNIVNIARILGIYPEYWEYVSSPLILLFEQLRYDTEIDEIKSHIRM